MDPFKTPIQEQLSAPGQAAHGSDNLGEGQRSELSQYQLDNLNCPVLVVFDNRLLAKLLASHLLSFGIGIASGLAFAHQWNNTSHT